MTRTEKIIRYIAGSFFLRNFILFVILLSTNTGIPLALGELSPKMLLIEAILMTNSYGCFLIHNLILYRFLLKRKKYLLYTLSVITLLVCGAALFEQMQRLLLDHRSDYPWQKWVAMIWVELIYYWASLCVYLAYEYYRDRERLFRIEQEKKELELKQLNEQLNPHFLFNALNNIYSHILQQSSTGKELILKLSELMRYVLDSSKKKQVPLAEEITFIEHYIAFEKERLGQRCKVHYEADIAPATNACIIPLVLFNFIENAFKHGTTAIKPTEMHIRIKANEEGLELFVRNEIHHGGSKTSTYTGMQNTRRRLELIYPEQFALDLQEEDHYFTVQLNLSDLKCYSAAS